MENKDRNIHLDVVAGLLILWMIYLDHLRYMSSVQTFAGYATLEKVFYFFMSWFYFKSGIFFSSKRTVKEVAKHDLNRFIVPYITGCALAILTQLTFLLSTGQFEGKPFTVRNLIDIFNHGGASWNIALWFLVSLYVVKIVFRWAINYVRPVNVAIVAIVISVVLHYLGLFRPALMANIPLGLFFYTIGYELKEKQYERFVVAAALIFGIILFYSNLATSFNFRINSIGEHDIYWMVIATCICNILIFNNLFRKITPPLLPLIGKNSMIFYVIHFPLGMLSCSIGADMLQLSSMSLYLFTCVLTTILMAGVYVVINKSNSIIVKLIIGQ